MSLLHNDGSRLVLRLRRHCEQAKAVMVRDQAGLTHVAVPLILGKQRLGAIIAGQVFDRYPEALSLRRVAKDVWGFGAATLGVGEETASCKRRCPPGIGRFALRAGSCISPATLWRDPRGKAGGDKRTFSVAGRGSQGLRAFHNGSNWARDQLE